MEDLLEQANEIQESLGRSYAVPDELDEADLQAGTMEISLFYSYDADCCLPKNWMPLRWKRMMKARRIWRTSIKDRTTSMKNLQNFWK